MSRLLVIFPLLAGIVLSIVSVSCDDKTDNFVAHDLIITPAVTESGESILIEFYIDNKGYRGVLSTWILEIDDEKVNEKMIRVEERNTTRGYFIFTTDSTGNHTVSIYDSGNERLSGWFFVADNDARPSTE